MVQAPWGTRALPELQLKVQESIDLPVFPASPESMLEDVRMFQKVLSDCVYATESHLCSQVLLFGIRKRDSVSGFYSIYRSLIPLLLEHLHAACIIPVPLTVTMQSITNCNVRYRLHKKVWFQLKENKIAPINISGGIPCQWVGSSHLGFDKHFAVVMTSYDIPLQSSAN